EILLVLGTSSSETALPGMIRKMRGLGCHESTVGLVIPTGYSFNLDGTNIYMAMAAIFLAQATNTPLGLHNQIALLVVAMISSKGASGVTGAGRKADIGLVFGEVNESLKAYRVNEHQHSPEITQQLSRIAQEDVNIVFVPHLVPLNRGILSTLYVKMRTSMSTADVVALYQKTYAQEPFVRVLDAGKLPQLKDVRGTNFCQIGIKADPKKNACVIVSIIDNLTKGAAGQAVQNMNIMHGFDERDGLLL
ncbi:MAG: cation:dicarboxylase symporter family transporter, partial [Candidatus Omnitrophota bacterium]